MVLNAIFISVLYHGSFISGGNQCTLRPQVTDKLYRVQITMSRIRTHNVSGDRN